MSFFFFVGGLFKSLKGCLGFGTFHFFVKKTCRFGVIGAFLLKCVEVCLSLSLASLFSVCGFELRLSGFCCFLC